MKTLLSWGIMNLIFLVLRIEPKDWLMNAKHVLCCWTVPSTPSPEAYFLFNNYTDILCNLKQVINLSFANCKQITMYHCLLNSNVAQLRSTIRKNHPRKKCFRSILVLWASSFEEFHQKGHISEPQHIIYLPFLSSKCQNLSSFYRGKRPTFICFTLKSL